MFNCGNPREPKGTSLGDPWWSLVTPFYKWCEWKRNEKTGTNDSKNGTNAFFQKTETESWGLPLMNGGLKTKQKGVIYGKNNLGSKPHFLTALKALNCTTGNLVFKTR